MIYYLQLYLVNGDGEIEVLIFNLGLSSLDRSFLAGIETFANNFLK